MRMILAVTALALGMTGAVCAQDGPPAIEIGGEGMTTAAPDMATLRTGVVGEGEDAAAAIEALNAGLDPVLDALEAAGVAAADIQTGTLQLNPVYADRGSEPRDPGQPPQIVGYRAESLLSVRARDLEGLGGLIDQMVDAGANRLDGIGFRLAEPQAAEDAALAAAVADAMRRASVIADAAGQSLGPILEIVEAGGGGGQPMMMRMAAEADAVAIAPGELEIRQSVRLKVALASE